MKTLVLTAILGLAGCASVPADLLENGVHYARPAKYGPAAVTRCMAGNVETRTGAVVVQRMDVENLRGMKVFISRDVGEPKQAIAATHVRRVDNGSLVEIWLAPDLAANHDRFVDMMMAGC